jgi:outer membrane protein assembly factor BamB
MRSTWVKLASNLAALTIVFIAIPGPTFAQPAAPDLIWLHQGIEDINAFAWLPDVDGDGIADVVIETYDAGASGDHLLLVSGGSTGSPQVIWSVRPQSGVSDGGGDGQECLVTCDDLNGDGRRDVLLGTAWGNRSVHAVDGMTGQVLWTFDSYNEPNSGWIYAVRALPDRTGDGVPEVAFGTGSDGNMAYLLDGSDGSVIWRFYGSADAVGHTVALPDQNGDDTADVLFCGWDNEHQVFCVSGAGSGFAQTIWSRDNGSSNYSATVIDDINDDGVAEVVAGTWSASNQVICLDGASGNPLWTFNIGAYEYVMRLVTIDDVDGDGFRDVAIGSWARFVPVISGRTGDLLWMSFAGSLNGGDFWTVAGTEDIDGDGLGEVVGGSFDGKVYLFSGADGDTLWVYDTSSRLFAVAGAPDLSGNGVPDVLGGTQYLSSGGKSYALEGGDPASPVPDLPAASGWARNRNRDVTLGWILDQPLPCVIDRICSEPDKAAGARRALAERFAAGELDTRAVVTARLADKSLAEQVTRLTPEPLEPTARGARGWSYAFADPEGQVNLQTSYRVSVILPDGREATVLQLAPGQGNLPRAVRQVALAPNPFNPRTELLLDLARPADVVVDVLDARGRLVGRLGPEPRPAGASRLAWDGTGLDGRSLPAGCYLMRVQAAGEQWVVKAMLVR